MSALSWVKTCVGAVGSSVRGYLRAPTLRAGAGEQRSAPGAFSRWSSGRGRRASVLGDTLTSFPHFRRRAGKTTCGGWQVGGPRSRTGWPACLCRSNRLLRQASQKGAAIDEPLVPYDPHPCCRLRHFVEIDTMLGVGSPIILALLAGLVALGVYGPIDGMTSALSAALVAVLRNQWCVADVHAPRTALVGYHGLGCTDRSNLRR